VKIIFYYRRKIIRRLYETVARNTTTSKIMIPRLSPLSPSFPCSFCYINKGIQRTFILYVVYLYACVYTLQQRATSTRELQARPHGHSCKHGRPCIREGLSLNIIRYALECDYRKPRLQWCRKLHRKYHDAPFSLPQNCERLWLPCFYAHFRTNEKRSISINY